MKMKSTHRRKSRLDSIELFSGAGGLALGTAMAGFHHAALFEIDATARKTLTLNQKVSRRRGISSWTLFGDDVRKTDFSVFAPLDLLAGGSPCQPFSHAGKRRGRMDRRDMIPEFVRAVREIQPKAFILENVRGLANSKFADYLDYVKLQLSYPHDSPARRENWRSHHARLKRQALRGSIDATYNVVSKVVNAADYGVPQQRQRLFIVGLRVDLGVTWEFPAPTHSLDALLYDQYVTGKYWRRHGIGRREVPEMFRRRVESLNKRPRGRPWFTVRDALADLPSPRKGGRDTPGYHNHRGRPGARTYPGHLGSDCDLPSKTLKAGRHGVAGGENVVCWPNGTHRYYTIREAARLQTFPDSWRFVGNWVDLIRQIGNAVPPKLAMIVGRSVAKALKRASSMPISRLNNRHSTRRKVPALLRRAA